MSKRKPATASKRALSHRKPAASKRSRPKVAALAQRNKQAFVRSPKGSDSEEETPVVENRAAALQAILQAALQDGFGQRMRDVSPRKGFDLPSLVSDMQAYQAKLLEMMQVNMQFAFEFGQRLATIKSPLEWLAVIVEFMGRRILMIGKHSKEMAAYPLWRVGA